MFLSVWDQGHAIAHNFGGSVVTNVSSAWQSRHCCRCGRWCTEAQAIALQELHVRTHQQITAISAICRESIHFCLGIAHKKFFGCRRVFVFQSLQLCQHKSCDFLALHFARYELGHGPRHAYWWSNVCRPGFHGLFCLSFLPSLTLGFVTPHVGYQPNPREISKA